MTVDSETGTPTVPFAYDDTVLDSEDNKAHIEFSVTYTNRNCMKSTTTTFECKQCHVFLLLT